MEAAGVLSTTFGLGIILHASQISFFHAISGHFKTLLLHRRRLVLLSFLLSVTLWSISQFATLLLLVDLPCQVAVLLTSFFDQSARILAFSLVVWKICDENQYGAEKTILWGLVGLRVLLGGAIVGFMRIKFMPVCFPESKIPALGFIQIGFEALVWFLLAVRVWRIWGLFADQGRGGRGEGKSQGYGLFLIVLSLAGWTAGSIPFILAVGSIFVRMIPFILTLALVLGILSLFPTIVFSVPFETSTSNEFPPGVRGLGSTTSSPRRIGASASPAISPITPRPGDIESNKRNAAKHAYGGGTNTRNSTVFRNIIGVPIVHPGTALPWSLDTNESDEGFRVHPLALRSSVKSMGSTSAAFMPENKRKSLVETLFPAHAGGKAGISGPILRNGGFGATAEETTTPFAAAKKPKTVSLKTAVETERQRTQAKQGREDERKREMKTPTTVKSLSVATPNSIASLRGMDRTTSVKRKPVIPIPPEPESLPMDLAEMRVSAVKPFRRLEPEQSRENDEPVSPSSRRQSAMLAAEENTSGNRYSTNTYSTDDDDTTRYTGYSHAGFPLGAPPRLPSGPAFGLPQPGKEAGDARVLFLNEIVYDDPALVKSLIDKEKGIVGKKDIGMTTSRDIRPTSTAIKRSPGTVAGGKPIGMLSPPREADESPGMERSRNTSKEATPFLRMRVSPIGKQRATYDLSPMSAPPTKPLPAPPTFEMRNSVDLVFPTPPFRIPSSRKAAPPPIKTSPPVILSPEIFQKTFTPSPAHTQADSTTTTPHQPPKPETDTPPMIPEKSKRRSSSRETVVGIEKLNASNFNETAKSWTAKVSTFNTKSADSSPVLEFDSLSSKRSPENPIDLQIQNRNTTSTSDMSNFTDSTILRKSILSFTTSPITVEVESDASTDIEDAGDITEDTAEMETDSSDEEVPITLQSEAGDMIAGSNSGYSSDEYDDDEGLSGSDSFEILSRDGIIISDIDDAMEMDKIELTKHKLNAKEQAVANDAVPNITVLPRHFKIGDRIPTFSDSQKSKRRKSPPSPIGWLMRARRISQQPPSFEPVVQQQIQTRLTMFAESEPTVPLEDILSKIPTRKQRGPALSYTSDGRNSLLARLEAEMSQQENQWMGMHKSLSRNSAASTLNADSPSHRLQKGSQPLGQRRSLLTRLQGSIDRRTSIAQTTSTLSSLSSTSWQRQLAEAQMDYLENAPSVWKKPGEVPSMPNIILKSQASPVLLVTLGSGQVEEGQERGKEQDDESLDIGSPYETEQRPKSNFYQNDNVKFVFTGNQSSPTIVASSPSYSENENGEDGYENEHQDQDTEVEVEEYEYDDDDDDEEDTEYIEPLPATVYCPSPFSESSQFSVEIEYVSSPVLQDRSSPVAESPIQDFSPMIESASSPIQNRSPMTESISSPTRDLAPRTPISLLWSAPVHLEDIPASDYLWNAASVTSGSAPVTVAAAIAVRPMQRVVPESLKITSDKLWTRPRPISIVLESGLWYSVKDLMPKSILLDPSSPKRSSKRVTFVEEEVTVEPTGFFGKLKKLWGKPATTIVRRAVEVPIKKDAKALPVQKGLELDLQKPTDTKDPSANFAPQALADVPVKIEVAVREPTHNLLWSGKGMTAPIENSAHMWASRSTASVPPISRLPLPVDTSVVVRVQRRKAVLPIIASKVLWSNTTLNNAELSSTKTWTKPHSQHLWPIGKAPFTPKGYLWPSAASLPSFELETGIVLRVHSRPRPVNPPKLQSTGLWKASSMGDSEKPMLWSAPVIQNGLWPQGEIERNPPSMTMWSAVSSETSKFPLRSNISLKMTVKNDRIVIRRRQAESIVTASGSMWVRSTKTLFKRGPVAESALWPHGKKAERKPSAIMWSATSVKSDFPVRSNISLKMIADEERTVTKRRFVDTPIKASGSMWTPSNKANVKPALWSAPVVESDLWPYGNIKRNPPVTMWSISSPRGSDSPVRSNILLKMIIDKERIVTKRVPIGAAISVSGDMWTPAKTPANPKLWSAIAPHNGLWPRGKLDKTPPAKLWYGSGLKMFTRSNITLKMVVEEDRKIKRRPAEEATVMRTVSGDLWTPPTENSKALPNWLQACQSAISSKRLSIRTNFPARSSFRQSFDGLDFDFEEEPIIASATVAHRSGPSRSIIVPATPRNSRALGSVRGSQSYHSLRFYLPLAEVDRRLALPTKPTKGLWTAAIPSAEADWCSGDSFLWQKNPRFPVEFYFVASMESLRSKRKLLNLELASANGSLWKLAPETSTQVILQTGLWEIGQGCVPLGLLPPAAPESPGMVKSPTIYRLWHKDHQQAPAIFADLFTASSRNIRRSNRSPLSLEHAVGALWDLSAKRPQMKLWSAKPASSKGLWGAVKTTLSLRGLTSQKPNLLWSKENSRSTRVVFESMHLDSIRSIKKSPSSLVHVGGSLWQKNSAGATAECPHDQLWRPVEKSATKVLWAVNGGALTLKEINFAKQDSHLLWNKDNGSVSPIFSGLSLESFRGKRDASTKSLSLVSDGLWSKHVGPIKLTQANDGLWGNSAAGVQITTSMLWHKNDRSALIFAHLTTKTLHSKKRVSSSTTLPLVSGELWKRQPSFPMRPQLWTPTPKKTGLWDADAQTKTLARISLEKKTHSKFLWSKKTASRTTTAVPERLSIAALRVSDNIKLVKASGSLWQPKPAVRRPAQLWRSKPVAVVKPKSAPPLWTREFASRTTDAVPMRTERVFTPSNAPPAVVSGSLWKKDTTEKIGLWKRPIKTVGSITIRPSAPLWTKESASRTTAAVPERNEHSFTPSNAPLAVVSGSLWTKTSVTTPILWERPITTVASTITQSPAPLWAKESASRTTAAIPGRSATKVFVASSSPLPKASGGLWQPKAKHQPASLWKHPIKPVKVITSDPLWTKAQASRTTSAIPIRMAIVKCIIKTPLTIVSRNLWQKDPSVRPKALWKRPIKTVASATVPTPVPLWMRESASRTTNAIPEKFSFAPKPASSKPSIIPAAASGNLWDAGSTTPKPISLWKKNIPRTGVWHPQGLTLSLSEIEKQKADKVDSLWKRRSAIFAAHADMSIHVNKRSSYMPKKSAVKPVLLVDAKGPMWENSQPSFAAEEEEMVHSQIWGASNSSPEEYPSPSLSRTSSVSDLSQLSPIIGRDMEFSPRIRSNSNQSGISLSMVGLWNAASDDAPSKKVLGLWSSEEASRARRSVLITERPARIALPAKKDLKLPVFDGTHSLWDAGVKGQRTPMDIWLLGSEASSGKGYSREDVQPPLGFLSLFTSENK